MAKLAISRSTKIPPITPPAPLRKVSSATLKTFHSPFAKAALASDAWTIPRGGGIIGSKPSPGKAGMAGQALEERVLNGKTRVGGNEVRRDSDQAACRQELEDERPFAVFGRTQGP